MSDAGALVLVGTPIGNLGDLSPRALDVLTTADVVCCEDTRHSGRLLSLSGVKAKRLLSVHGHNEADRASEIVAMIAGGATVALVTDAGMPAISDPGATIVAAVHAAGLKVSAVPGPSAATMAVAVSGLAVQRWRFEGFLPRRGGARRARLEEIARSPDPTVVFEAPSRVGASLADLADICGGDRVVVVCRELTKLHEDIWHGPLSAAAGRYGGSPRRQPPAAAARTDADHGSARGEFALVIAGAPELAAPEVDDRELASLIAALVESGVSRRDAISDVASRLGLARRQVYAAATKPPGSDVPGQ